jgi:hypothetical protein
MQNKTNAAWKIYVAKKSFIVCLPFEELTTEARRKFGVD